MASAERLVKVLTRSEWCEHTARCRWCVQCQWPRLSKWLKTMSQIMPFVRPKMFTHQKKSSSVVIKCYVHSIKWNSRCHIYNNEFWVVENARFNTRVNDILCFWVVYLDLSDTVGGDMLRALMLYPVYISMRTTHGGRRTKTDGNSSLEPSAQVS